MATSTTAAKPAATKAAPKPATKRNSGKPKATLPTLTQAPDVKAAEKAKAAEAARAAKAAAKVAEKEAAKANENKASIEAASRMARLFDDTKSTFDRAKAAHVAVEKGAALAIVADELSMIRAKAAYPEATEIELDFYASNPASKGGTQISKASLHAYASSWESIIKANLAHDAELVGLAFRQFSKGGTANVRTEAERRSHALVAQGKVDEARALYIEAARLNLRGVDMFGLKPKVAPKAEPTDDSGEVEVEVVKDGANLTVTSILGQIKSWRNAPLSDSDLDRIMDAMAEFAATVKSVRA